MAYFIGSFMGPQFEKDGVETDIWLGTINYSDPAYCATILNNESAAKYIKGVGFQWGGEKAIPTISKQYPDFKYMQTENKCGECENDWSSVERSWSSIVHYMKNGCESYIYWNMILDQTGKSAWGWPQNSMIIINRETKAVTYTDEYYLFKHLSHFVQPGAKYLETSQGDNHIAFKMADGRTLLMVYNPEKSAKSIKVKFGETIVAADLKPVSINSIIL